MNVLRLVMPPLRERPTDIPILAQHFVHQACVEAGLPIKTLSCEAADALVRAAWPGNVRELLNVMQRAVVFADGGTILPRHLTIASTTSTTSTTQESPLKSESPPSASLPVSLSASPPHDIFPVRSVADSDVFLWKPLPEDLRTAPLVAQNPEFFVPGESFYRPEVFEAALDGAPDTWLPPEWRWYRAIGWSHTIDEAFEPEAASRLGYTHLIADAKRNPELMARLEARVERDCPAYYARVLDRCARL